MAQFFVGAYITLVGYPFVVALTSGIYSRVLGNIPQVNTNGKLCFPIEYRKYFDNKIDLN